MECTITLILKHWEVISTLYLGHPFYWRLGIKTSSTGKEGSVSGNNWGNIACLEERAMLLREGPESHFIFLPITFSFFVFFFSSFHRFWIKAMLSGCFECGEKGKMGGSKSRVRWVGLMWLRELPARRRRGTLMGMSIRKKCGAYIYIYICTSPHFVCMCVCVSYVTVSSHPTYPTLLLPLFSLPLFLFLFYFSPSLHAPLFTLTVIWQVRGWQPWRRQGKRLSGLVLLGSCWLAEELAVRLGSCYWPGDW